MTIFMTVNRFVSIIVMDRLFIILLTLVVKDRPVVVLAIEICSFMVDRLLNNIV